MVFTCFHMVKLIVEQQQHSKAKAAYGEEVIKQLSFELTRHFEKSFSQDNKENMPSFYLLYLHRFDSVEISETLSRKLKSPSQEILQTMPTNLVHPVKSETATQISFAETFPLSWTHYLLLSRIKIKSQRSF